MEEIRDVKGVLDTGLETILTVKSVNTSTTMSTVVVALSADDIAVSIPVKDGLYRPLPIGAEVEASYTRDDGRYFYNTRVKSRIIYEGMPVLLLNMPTRIMRWERRQYYRIDTFFPVKLILTSFAGKDKDRRIVKDVYDTHCVNISGGGMEIDPARTGLPIKLKTVLEIDFCEALPGLSMAKGVVCRPPIEGKLGWGIKFTKIFDCDRDKIIRYVFKKQLELQEQLNRAFNNDAEVN